MYKKPKFSAENAFMLTVCWLYVDCMLTDVDCMLTVLSTGILRHPFLGRSGRLHARHLPVTQWLRHCQGVTVRWAQGDSCKYNSSWNISLNVCGKLIANNLVDLWRVELHTMSFCRSSPWKTGAKFLRVLETESDIPHTPQITVVEIYIDLLTISPASQFKIEGAHGIEC